METVDKIDNLSLIENSLLHMRFELDRESPSYFRLAREAHLLLYRTMIESLTRSNWQNVTGHRSKAKYQIEDKPWQEIHKVPIKGCRKAWRFSDPAVYTQLPMSTSVEVPLAVGKEYLIGFYDALAMIQTECFMGGVIFHKPILISEWISDEEMKTFEWLHEDIRNEYEHFKPKFYRVGVHELLMAAELCLSVSKVLLFESVNVIFHTVTKKSLKELLESVFKGVVSHSKRTADNITV
ncbi:MAG: hypothetical protein LUQ65_12305 [Candidatus Helarchaeota archaeon]|nr:hypothetical protein [Candidatus Helarchaeota archaeon]